jgi:hypothetical protein
MGYDISPLKRIKLKILTTRILESGEISYPTLATEGEFVSPII